MTELPHVCVIGAGVSGLTAGKALGDWGVPYTCFEASDDIGGNWYFKNPNARSSASLHMDISKPSISFRDFPMPDRYPDYPHHSEILEYEHELRRKVIPAGRERAARGGGAPLAGRVARNTVARAA